MVMGLQADFDLHTSKLPSARSVYKELRIVKVVSGVLAYLKGRHRPSA